MNGHYIDARLMLNQPLYKDARATVIAYDLNQISAYIA